MEEIARDDIPVLISVEGTVSSGKSSLIEYYTGRQINRVSEPLDIWTDFEGYNVLGLRYKEPEKYAFPFQILADLTRLEQLKEISTSTGITIMERSLLISDEIFGQLGIGGVESKILKQWHRFLREDSGIRLDPDLFVYIRVPAVEAYKRCQSRGRKEEMKLPLEFFQDLERMHDEVFLDKANSLPAPVLILDGDCTLSQMADQIMDIEGEVQRIRTRKHLEEIELAQFMASLETNV